MYHGLSLSSSQSWDLYEVQEQITLLHSSVFCMYNAIKLQHLKSNARRIIQ